MDHQNYQFLFLKSKFSNLWYVMDGLVLIETYITKHFYSITLSDTTQCSYNSQIAEYAFMGEVRITNELRISVRIISQNPNRTSRLWQNFNCKSKIFFIFNFQKIPRPVNLWINIIFHMAKMQVVILYWQQMIV